MTNPLLAKTNGYAAGAIGFEAVQAYADELNRMNFSRLLGYHWCVNERALEDGTTERFLDRQSATG